MHHVRRSRQHRRLSFDEALTLWEARDVYRLYALVRGMLVVFFGLEYLFLTSRGYWYVGVLLIAAQVGLLWGLRVVLRWAFHWAHWGLWWGIDQMTAALATWWQAHWRSQ